MQASYLVLDLPKREGTLLGPDMPAKYELSGPEGGPIPIDIWAIIGRREGVLTAS